MNLVGSCVELHGMEASLEKKRGIVVKQKNSTFTINLDGSLIKVPRQNLCVVFCLGLPRECRMIVQSRGEEISQTYIREVVSKVDSSKFYVFYIGRRDGSDHFVTVRIPYFQMMMTSISKQNREALVRIYVCNYSQDGASAKIKFGNLMEDVSFDPAHVDLDSNLMKSLCQIKPSVAVAEWNVQQELARVGKSVDAQSLAH
jgi:hypothetical protein